MLICSAPCAATAHQKKREEEKSELSVSSVGEEDNSVRDKKIPFCAVCAKNSINLGYFSPKKVRKQHLKRIKITPIGGAIPQAGA